MPIIEDTVTNSDGEVVTIYIEVDEAQALNPYRRVQPLDMVDNSTSLCELILG